MGILCSAGQITKLCFKACKVLVLGNLSCFDGKAYLNLNEFIETALRP
jgi:hypothetical protein